MARQKRRRNYAIAPILLGCEAGAAHLPDPDPIHPDHFMFVLDWQERFPNHMLASVGTYKLAREIREIARRAINDAITEIEQEEDDYATCSTEQPTTLKELVA